MLDPLELHHRRAGDPQEGWTRQPGLDLRQRAGQPEPTLRGPREGDGVLQFDQRDVVHVQVEHPPPPVRGEAPGRGGGRRRGRLGRRGGHGGARRRGRHPGRNARPEELADPLKGALELGRLDWLQQVVQPLERERLHRMLGVRRGEHRRRPQPLGQAPTDLVERLRAGAPGHVDVQQEQLRTQFEAARDGLLARARLAHDLDVGVDPQQSAHAAAGERFVVDDQGADHVGSSILNRVPSGTSSANTRASPR